MSHDKKKVTPVESAKAWVAKHQNEGLDLKTLHAALTAVEKKTAEAQSAASHLGEILIARKDSLKLLKKALKEAKNTRKLPPAAKPVPVKKPTVAKKAAPVKKTAPAKKAPADQTTSAKK